MFSSLHGIENTLDWTRVWRLLCLCSSGLAEFLKKRGVRLLVTSLAFCSIIHKMNQTLQWNLNSFKAQQCIKWEMWEVGSILLSSSKSNWFSDLLCMKHVGKTLPTTTNSTITPSAVPKHLTAVLCCVIQVEHLSFLIKGLPSFGMSSRRPFFFAFVCRILITQMGNTALSHSLMALNSAVACALCKKSSHYILVCEDILQ